MNKKFFNQLAFLALRFAIGLGFIVHGMAKFNRGPDKFAHVLEWMHVPVPQFTAWLVTVIEIAGGLAIILGVLMALVSIPLIVIHIVAIIGVHWQHGYSSINTIGLDANGPIFGPPGYEINLLYIGGLLVLASASSMIEWSVDNFLRRRFESP